MNYLLYGIENFFIDKEIKSIIDKGNFDDINISHYDLDNDLISNIVDDANTISLFNSNKLIIVDNAFIFSRTTKKIDDTELIQSYLENPNPSTTIIFVNRLENIDSVKKIVKSVKNKGVIKEFNPLKSINDTVINMFDDYKIDSNTVNYFINRVGNNLEIINNEIDKLKLFKLNNKIITKEDINNICIENVSIDIFKFVDDIINKDKKSAIKTYKELLKINEEPIKIVALLASKFRLMYQSCILTKKGFTEDKISEILGVHKYPVHLSILAGYKYNPDLILKYLNDLADLDIGIKTGTKDKELALELFILGL